jgi:YesN/AraC family two-component response regulator
MTFVRIYDRFIYIMKKPNQLIQMSNLEDKKEENSSQRRPYNLKEKKKKTAAYRNLIRPQLASELYEKIKDIVINQKMYRRSDFSAKDLANQLKTNTRYLSAVINSRFGKNYSCLHNECRIKEAMQLLGDKKLADKNIEEISAIVGFANRQSFYAAFYKYTGETPNGYRKRKLTKKRTAKPAQEEK